MKKIISIMMVLVMVLSMGTMSFAIDEEQYQSASIDCNVDGYYIINIPNEIHVGEQTWVTAEELNIIDESYVTVEIANMDDNGYIQLTNADETETVFVRFRAFDNTYISQRAPAVGPLTSTGGSIFFTPELVGSDNARAGYYTGSVDFRIVYHSRG